MFHGKFRNTVKIFIPRTRSTNDVLQKKIEQRAYEIWENEGGSHGFDIDHWLQAEAEIKVADGTKPPDIPMLSRRP